MTASFSERSDERMLDAPEVALRAVASGAAWNYSGYGASKIASFASTIVLARLLVPEQFGIVALAVTVITYLDALRDFGLPDALVQWDDDVRDERIANVALTLNVLAGAFVALLVVLTAPHVSAFFREPELAPVLRVLSASIVFESLGSVHDGLLRRRLRFRRRMGPEIVRAVAKGIIAIALALSGFGVWSLVWGQIGAAAAATATYWYLSDWRPRPAFDRTVARGLLTFGGTMTVIGLAQVVVRDLDFLIIGRALDADRLGIYQISFRVPTLVVISTCQMVGLAAFPVFSRLGGNRPAQRETFRRMVLLLTSITLPAGVGLLVITPELVPTVYGAQWLDAIPVMQVLALMAAAKSLSYVTGGVHKAAGRLGLLTAITTARVPVGVVALILGVRWGIIGVAYAQLFIATLFAVLQLAILARVLGMPATTLLRALRPAAIATSVVGAVAYGVRMATGGLVAPARMGVVVVAGVAAFAIVYLLTRELRVSAQDLLRRIGRRHDDGTAVSPMP